MTTETTLQQLTKRVLESTLEGEISDHVGYDKRTSAGKGSGNSRYGIRARRVRLPPEARDGRVAVLPTVEYH
jgi:transposase-like protein